MTDTQTSTEPLGVGFKTPGLIDIRAFTMFGVNSKPMTDNPIGFFGTGLKYAIAVLLREKHSVIIWIGNDRYEFESGEEIFRDKSFTCIYIKKSHGLLKRFSRERLPFTTELGKHWALWQAFGELESNTRDEGGTTDYIFNDPLKWEGQPAHSMDRTMILVGGQKFVDVYNERDDVFLDKDRIDLRFADSKAGIEVYNVPSKHVYYRGMRVYDLPKDKISKYTYNFTRQMDLTEDRTLKYAFYMFTYLANLVIQSTDKAFIKAIVESDKDSFENEFSFDGSSATPSDEYKLVLAVKRHGGYLSGASSFFSRYSSPPSRPKPHKKSSRGDELVNELATALDDHDSGDDYNYSKEDLFTLLAKCHERLIKEEPVIIDALTEEEVDIVEIPDAVQEEMSS